MLVRFFEECYTKKTKTLDPELENNNSYTEDELNHPSRHAATRAGIPGVPTSSYF